MPSLSPDDWRHGTGGGYSNWGCRCDRCRAAFAKDHREYMWRTGRCRPWAEYIAEVTSVREDTLKCSSCRMWKPDDAFTSNVSDKHRRGRHNQCTPCQTIARRKYRHKRAALIEQERLRYLLMDAD